MSTNIDWQKALEETARNLWMSAAINACPAGIRLFDRMQNPKLGDIVTEITTRDKTPDKTGTLINFSGEGCERKWTIQTDNGTQNWTNAQFIAIPMDFDWWQK